MTRHRKRRFVPIPLVTLALASCSHGDAQAPAGSGASAVAVRVTPVLDTVVVRPIVATGTVEPGDAATLSFKVGGVIASIAVDAGDAVRAGQTLASLDLREIDAALAKARTMAYKADRDLVRARRLHADSVVTLAQLQDAETAAQVAHADLEAATVNRRYAEIVAPVSGTVLRRTAEPSEMISPGTPVLMLGSWTSGSVLRVGLADRDVVRVHKGDRAVLHFDAWPERVFQGAVTRVEAAADPATGTFNVEVRLRDDGTLVAGLVGRAEIRPRGGIPARLVPVDALLEADGDTATVYVPSTDQRKAERRRVTVAFIDGAHAAVSAGLEGAAGVLTGGAARLTDGAAIRVMP